MTRTVWSALVLFALLPLTIPQAGAEEPAPAARTVDLENTICPVKHKPVAPGVTATVDGVTVHFCCTGCAAKYSADPASYQTALRSEPAVARKLDLVKAGAPAVPPPPAMPAMPGGPAARLDAPAPAADPLRDAMRSLWEEHVVWTRQFIVSATGNLPDKDAVTKRLLRNQTDIGEGVKPYYGEAAGTQLTTLLTDHIKIAAELVEASVAGDAPKAEDAKTRWVANADEISAFLSKANPSWPLEDMKSMMREHLDLTAAQATARIQKDWDGDIAAYEKVREQATKMADMLADGIRKQFPQKFQ
jgi:hypothetical protein